MDFVLFILLNAALFIRPGEVSASLQAYPIYLWLILACLVVAHPQVLAQFRREVLINRPVTVCVLGIWIAAILSHLLHLAMFEAKEIGADLGKIILYYLLLVAVVNTPERLRKFLLCLVGFIFVLSLLAVLHHRHVIEIPSLTVLEQKDIDEESGEEVIITRLRATGIFEDPNDICLALGMGILSSLYLMGDTGLGPVRFVGIIPIGLFLYAMRLTQSRGGAMGIAAGILTMVCLRYGWKKGVGLALLGAPLLLLTASGRQANFNMGKKDTAHERVELWSEGLIRLRSSPISGIGAGQYADQMGLVAHNSLVHAYVELGFFGGTLFFGAFFCIFLGLYRQAQVLSHGGNEEVARFFPYITGIVVGYGAGLLSLSRCYAVPTYLIFALANAFLIISGEMLTHEPVLQVTGNLVKRLLGASLACLILLHVVVRVLLSAA